MLHTVLLILKILGIVLLCILGILVILALSVVFIPVRYKVLGQKAETLWAEAHISWWLNIVSVYAEWRDGPNVVFRLFGIPIYNMKKRKAREKARLEKQGRRAAAGENGKAPETEEKPGKADAPKKDGEPKKAAAAGKAEEPEKIREAEKIKTPPGDVAGREKPPKAKKKSFFCKCKEFFGKVFHALRNMEYTIRKLCDRIKKAADQAAYYKKIWESEERVRAYGLCTKQLLAIFKNIRPDKLKLYLKIGSEDPEITGRVLSWYGRLYPLLYRNIQVEPYFDRNVLEGDFYCRGKITFFFLLRAAWKIYFDKDIRELLKLIKKEEN